jgi:hypothetical protein
MRSGIPGSRFLRIWKPLSPLGIFKSCPRVPKLCVEGDFKDICTDLLFFVSMGGQAECCACADKGAPAEITYRTDTDIHTGVSIESDHLKKVFEPNISK